MGGHVAPFLIEFVPQLWKATRDFQAETFQHVLDLRIRIKEN